MRPEMIMLFVYNLDKGSLADIRNHLHSTVSAQTPQCNLWALISSPVGMKKSWKRFTSELGVPVQYLYRDEFAVEFGPLKFPFPAVYLKVGETLKVMITSEEINRCAATDDLIAIVNKRLEQILQ